MQGQELGRQREEAVCGSHGDRRDELWLEIQTEAVLGFSAWVPALVNDDSWTKGATTRRQP